MFDSPTKEQQSVKNTAKNQLLSKRVEVTRLRDCLLVATNIIALRVDHDDIAELVLAGLSARFGQTIAYVAQDDELDALPVADCYYVKDPSPVQFDYFNQRDQSVVIAFDQKLPVGFEQSFIIDVASLTPTELVALLQWHALQYENVIEISAQVLTLLAQWVSRFYATSMRYSCALDMLAIAVARALDDKQLLARLEVKHVAQVIADWQDLACVDNLFDAYDQQALVKYVNEQVLGQEQVFNYMLQAEAPKPFLYLFVGESGVGKTNAARALATFYNGDPSFLIRIDFSLFYHAKSLRDIVVLAPGAKQTADNLLSLMVRFPNVVLLFEHVEGYMQAFERLFSSILATGFLYDSAQAVDCRAMKMIILSNKGGAAINLAGESEDMAAPGDGLMPLLQREERPAEAPKFQDVQSIVLAVEPMLAEQFSHAVLRRSLIVPFMPLTDQGVADAINKKLKVFQHRIAYELHYTPEVVDFIRQQVRLAGNQLLAIDHVIEEYIASCLLRLNDSAATVKLVLNDTGQWLIAMES